MIELFGHPFSSYTWKVLIALYENATPFTFHSVEEPINYAGLKRLWAPARFPLLVDDGCPGNGVERHHRASTTQSPRPRPADSRPIRVGGAGGADAGSRVRQPRHGEHAARGERRAAPARAPRSGRGRCGPNGARHDLRLAGRMDDRVATWAAGVFSLADCAAAPALFYADWVHPIGDEYARLQDYRARLLARSSVARCVEEARPYRAYFPLGAPDRD